MTKILIGVAAAALWFALTYASHAETRAIEAQSCAVALYAA